MCAFILANVPLSGQFEMMIERRILATLREALTRQAAVVLFGPRQVGKTTLAQIVAAETKAIYLDLEAAKDRDKVADAALYLGEHADKLIVLDEIQRLPGLFETLRGLIDEGRRTGRVQNQSGRRVGSL